MGKHARGELGFLDLPDDAALLAQTTRFAEQVRGRFTDVVVLGIGGSALGPDRAAHRAAPAGLERAARGARGGRRGCWCSTTSTRHHPRHARGARPRAHALSGDVEVGRAPPRRWRSTSSCAARSTSGSGARATEHLVFITDPGQGLAAPDRAAAGASPRSTSRRTSAGRFSVLAPVGVLPAALIGIDVAALLAGAGDLRRRCADGRAGRQPGGARSPRCSGSRTRGTGAAST
jgi:glucose-6-phosphate isomerase